MKHLSPPPLRIVVYDDYNSSFPQDKSIIGTVTSTFGHSELRNAWKLLIIYETI